MGRPVPHNIALKMAAELVSRGTRMALAIVAARWLGPAGFGDYSYAFAVGFLLGEFADLGLHFFLARQVAQDPAASIGPLVRLKLMASLACGVIGLVIGLLAGGSSPRRVLVWLLTVAWLLASFIEMLNQVFRGRRSLGREAMISIVMAVAAFGLGSGAVVLKLGAVGLASALVVAHLLALMLALFLVFRLLERRQWAMGARTRPSPDFVREAWPLALAMLASRAYFQIDILMLGWMRTAEAVGDMSAVLRLIAGAMVLSGAVQAAVFPAFAASNSAEARRRLAFLACVTLAGAGALVSAGAWWLGEPIIRLVFGSQYMSAVHPLQIMATALIWMLPEYTIGPLLFAAHQARPYAFLWLTAVLLITVGDLWAVPAYGPTGAAAVKLVITLGLVIGEVLVLWRVRDDLGARSKGTD